MKTLVEVAALLKRNLPPMRHWPRGVFVAWLHFFQCYAALIVLRDREGKLVAAGLGRRLGGIHYRHLRGVHHRAGKIIWVDALVCFEKGGMRVMLEKLLQKFEGAEEIAFSRLGKKGKYKIYPLEKFTLRINNAGR